MTENTNLCIHFMCMHQSPIGCNVPTVLGSQMKREQLFRRKSRRASQGKWSLEWALKDEWWADKQGKASQVSRLINTVEIQRSKKKQNQFGTHKKSPIWLYRENSITWREEHVIWIRYYLYDIEQFISLKKYFLRKMVIYLLSRVARRIKRGEKLQYMDVNSAENALNNLFLLLLVQIADMISKKNETVVLPKI